MKQRIGCFLMLAMVVIFAACGAEPAEPTADGAADDECVIILDDSELFESPYTISMDENGHRLVVLSPKEDGTLGMELAENTTVETFLSVVAAKEGYTVTLTGPDGKRLTEAAAVIPSGTVFGVYAQGADTPDVSMVIQVVPASQIAPDDDGRN